MTTTGAPCHPERALYAKGMCHPCYMRDYDTNRRRPRPRKDPSEYAANYRRPPRQEARAPECHPDRKHAANGLCGACYQRERAERPRATCHPARAMLADGLCRACYSKRRYWANPDEYRAKARERGAELRRRMREELVEAYGGRCVCPRCPETDPAFLTLDHVNGDGQAHRLKLGSHTYADLRRRGWPTEGYRLLCWNCNAMTRGGRTCPHEQET